MFHIVQFVSMNERANFTLFSIFLLCNYNWYLTFNCYIIKIITFKKLRKGDSIMFGYVKICKANLTLKDYLNYKEYYCGTCQTLGSNFGLLSKGTLNYDTVFLAIVLSGINNNQGSFATHRSFCSRFKFKKIKVNKHIEFSSYLNIILTYYKLLDNCADEKNLKSKIIMMLFKNKYLKAKMKYPDLDLEIAQTMNNINKLEMSKCSDVEQIGSIFGNLIGKIATYNNQTTINKELYKIGFYLGKYIYLADCIDDLEKDIRKDRFNPFRYMEKIDYQKIKNLAEKYITNIEEIIVKINLHETQNIINNVISEGLRRTIKSKIKMLDRKFATEINEDKINLNSSKKPYKKNRHNNCDCFDGCECCNCCDCGDCSGCDCGDCSICDCGGCDC